MTPAFEVFIIVDKPPALAYEAVADPARLSAYFTTAGAKGRAETGATVTWEFADFPGPLPVEIIEATPNESIAFRWASNEKTNNEKQEGTALKTEVRFRFEPLDNGMRTKVTVSEGGWTDTSEGLKASYGNCMGWSQMLCAMKAWLEYGINLRKGAYV